MEINDKALDAAVRALFEDGCGEPKVDAATMLEAAAPFIAAQALREAARVDFLEGYSEHARLYREDVATDLRNRADELEAGK